MMYYSFVFYYSYHCWSVIDGQTPNPGKERDGVTTNTEIWCL